MITPIYKKQGKPINDPNSYRRIMVSSIVGKIFEKLHLGMNVDTHNTRLNKPQNGFTKGMSPHWAALLLTESIAECTNRKEPLYAAFLDTSKAFDVVWHKSMLRCLYTYGLVAKDWTLMVRQSICTSKMGRSAVRHVPRRARGKTGRMLFPNCLQNVHQPP